MESNLDPNYAARLIRQALEAPNRLAEEKKFWKLELFPYYLRRAEKLLWEDIDLALAFLEPAPAFAAQIAEAHPTANGADFMILGYSYLGNVYRKRAEYPSAQEQFDHAAVYRASASPEALAKYLELRASLCIALHRPEAFDLLAEALAIHKRGNLVHRHEIGRCLVTRATAYHQFDQPDKILGDLTAALNHLSINDDSSSYYCALHNLAAYAVIYGDEDDLHEAIRNLKPARAMLRSQRHHDYAKALMRHLFGLLEARLGNLANAELIFRQVSTLYRRLKQPLEVGIVQLDLARLYLEQGKRQEVRELARQTVRLFRELGNDGGAKEALELWHQAFRQNVTDRHLLETRRIFCAAKQPCAA